MKHAGLIRKRRPLAYVIATFAALVALSMGLVGVIAPAMAAPPYATVGTVSNVKFNSPPIQSGMDTELSADWSITDNPVSPAGFVLALPPELPGRGDTFPLLDPSNVAMGSCVTTATELQCDLDAAYIAANPKDIHGTVKLWVNVKTVVTEETTVTYKFGTISATTSVIPPTVIGPCTEGCEFTGLENAKTFVSFDYNNASALWNVQVEAPESGMAGGESVVIKDNAGTDMATVNSGGMPKLQMADTVGPDDLGQMTLVNWTDVPLSDYTVSVKGDQISFIAKKGYFYLAFFQTTLTDGGHFGDYVNSADVTIGTTTTANLTSAATYLGGSGTGIGTDVGVFTITKALTGDVTGLDPEMPFTGSYTVTTPDGTANNGTYSVQAGQKWTSAQFPRDSTVVLTEDAPKVPSNIIWASPSFSTNNFTLPGGTSTAVTLTNNATAKLATFAASKKVDAGDSVLALIPSDATVQLDYSYPAGAGFAAGSGSLTLPLSGESVTSPELPVGAVLTFSEVTPEAIKGTVWGTPVITPSSLTIADGAVASVVVTNPLTPLTGDVSWNKVDPASAALSGSEWSLTGPDGTSIAVVDNGTNDADPADGALKVTGLAWGNYSLQETLAPAGYALNSETKSIVIGANALSVSFGDVVNTLIPETTPPATETTPPATETTPPATETTPPATETTPPATETTPPATETTPPATETTPPATETTPPVTETTPPVTETTPPATETTPVSPGVTPSTTVPATTVPVTTVPASPSTPAKPPLANTGADSSMLVMAGGALVFLAAGGLLIASRSALRRH